MEDIAVERHFPHIGSHVGDPGLGHTVMLLEIAEMPLTPYPYRLLFFLWLIISGDNVIITDQLIFQSCAFICHVFFHKNSLLKIL